MWAFQSSLVVQALAKNRKSILAIGDSFIIYGN